MKQAEITKLVKQALEANPDFLIKNFLLQQIELHKEQIKYENAQILRLRKELGEL